MTTSAPLWLVLAACQQTEREEPAHDALDTLVQQVLLPSGFTEDSVLVHEVAYLAPGAVVEAAFSGEPSEMSEPTTLFLVDASPGASWAHEVTWIYVDDDGDLHDELHDMFPVVDGEAFLPEHHPAAWGLPWQPTAPDAVDEDEELELWEEGSGGGARRYVGDVCQPARPRLAVTISGGDINATQNDEMNWRLLLQQRGFAVDSIRVTPEARQVTPQQVLSALAEAQAAGPLEELVVVYSGHGLQQGGTWAFGTRTVQGTLGQAQLVAALAGIETRKLTVILGSCYSGQLAQGLPAALKAAGMKETAIAVHAATQPDQKAWIEKDRPRGSAYMRRLFSTVAGTDPGEPIPWKELAVSEFNADTLVGLRRQEPTHGLKPRCIPEILHMLHPERQECLATWIHAQDYDRNVTLFGLGFGETIGRVEMEQEDGDWVTVPVSYWSDEAIMLNLPMRRDGFPASGQGPSVSTVEPPGSNWGGGGRYVVRVTPAEGESSDPEPVELVYQVYEQQWTPVVDGWDFPDWVEMWHPLTPEALWTNGPTVQLSKAWNASIEGSPVPPLLTVLDFDQDQAHVTSHQLLSVGTWSYDLPPALRDLATAYDQSLPGYQYWGFRLAFPDDDVIPNTWGFTLIYD
jgi:hypothetical protein